MAIYSHNNRSITYQIEATAFNHDLVLMQSSRFSLDFWQPVIEQLKDEEVGTGRVLICNWCEKGLEQGVLAEDMEGLLRTLGLNSVRIVACEDAVDVVNRIEKIRIAESGTLRIEKTLTYPKQLPGTDELVNAIREFSQT